MSLKTKNTIKGSVLMVVLLLLIFFEFKFGFDMMSERMSAETNTFMQLAAQHGKASVTVEEIVTYDEVPEVAEDGDVIELSDYDIKLKINGTLTDNSMSSFGYYNYSSATDKAAKTIDYDIKTSAVEDMQSAIDGYWHGDTFSVLSVPQISYNSEELEFYQCTFKSGNVPVIYNSTAGLYYMFVLKDNAYIIVSAEEPFILTDEKATVHFGDPNANPMYSHSYSEYEMYAAENTKRELLDKEEGEEVDNPYTSSNVVGTAETYTSSSDNTIRKQMVSYSRYKWEADGSSKETSLRIDIATEEAKKSEWTLTATTYSYEHAGLKLSMLSGKRSSETFFISGNINNLLDSERPYVIVVKFLNSQGQLLGIRVIDSRETPLEPSGVDVFSTTLTKEDTIDMPAITAVQFEVY